VDHLNGDPTNAEIYAESTDTGRVVTTSSEFTLRVAPENVGVLLRRKLDYGVADQRADVFVADDVAGAPFAHAGTWYAAGSTRAVFADAPTETGVPAPVIQESNRRWRDDELLIRRELTTGRSALRVRIVVTRDPPRPIVPGAPTDPPRWTEFRYTAFAWVK
jgi:hypothetical protein